ncbi:MAG: chromate transporter [Oscillospiraceae bacterium]|jgi:chromate transporter|nr:chromate transporter [Oscillospiraceae bacterium]
MKVSLKMLMVVFWSTFKVGMFTFGGGLAMIPLIQAEFCEKRGWIDMEQLTDITAAAQSLPGVMAVNMSILTGYRVGGFSVAIAAGVGAVLPSFIIICVVAMFYNAVIENPYVQGALRGIGAAVAAMFINTLRKMRKSSLADWWSVGFFAVALALMFFVPGLNVIFIIIGGGVLGYLLRYAVKRKK